MIRAAAPVLVHDLGLAGDDCVERETFLLELAAGKRVVHFGFLDSIFMAEKVMNGSLLHTRLAAVAASLYGVDVAEETLDAYRELTGDYNNCVWDVAVGVIPQQLRLGYELVLFPEVLEHVPDPGLVLRNLAQLCTLNGARLCLTVPNAFDMYGFMAAMHGIEVVHPDHLYTFTPSTFSRLLERSGFTLQRLCYYNFGSCLSPGLTKAGMIAVCECRA